MDSSNCITKNSNTQTPSFKPQLHRVLPQGHRFFEDCLRESYARWIEWAVMLFKDDSVWFVTQTFQKEVTEGKALRLSHAWLYRLMQGYRRNFGHRIRWVRAMALQKRGVIHFHLLVCAKDLSLLSRKRWEHVWESMDRNNGFCRIYDSDNRKTPGYLAREISKEGGLTWGGDWQGLNTPGAVGCCHTNGGGTHGLIVRMARRS